MKKQKDIYLTTPRRWNDLTAKEVLFICRLMLAGIDEQNLKVRAFIRLTGIKMLSHRHVKTILRKKTILFREYVFRKGRVKFRLHPDELNFFLHNMEFLVKGYELTDNKFPSIKVKGKKLYGPQNKCYNLTFREFIHCSRQVFEFERDKADAALDKLCAILYRKPKKHFPGSPNNRERFDEFKYVMQARKFKKVSKRLKMAIYIFYSSSTSAMISHFSNLFSKSVVSSSTEPKNPVPGLIDSVKLLTGMDPTKQEIILDMDVWNAFDYLDTLIKNSPKPEKK